MAEKHLHIVSFDVPLPADYGGVIDVFYKVKALHKAGVNVHLHCFAYGRESTEELKKYCKEVFYYPRNMNKSLLMHPLPFIVVSRQHDALLDHLKKDNHPILFEGLHSTYYLDHPDLTERAKYVRTHNVEHDYYEALAKDESSFFKKIYLKSEAKKLKRFERQLALAKELFAISPNDLAHFSEINERVTWISPFHSNEDLAPNGPKKLYALYHGNLSVMENEKAAMFLVDEVFNKTDKELKIFGNGASARLKKKIQSRSNISLIEGNGDTLIPLVKEAQINILPTFQATGMKLKLLFSLFNGGHCLVNAPMVEETGLEACCVIAEDAEAMKVELEKLWANEFSEGAYQERKSILLGNFSNEKQAKQLIEHIYA